MYWSSNVRCACIGVACQVCMYWGICQVCMYWGSNVRCACIGVVVMSGVHLLG